MSDRNLAWFDYFSRLKIEELRDGNFAIADLLDSEPLFTATINTKARDVIRHVVIPVSKSVDALMT